MDLMSLRRGLMMAQRKDPDEQYLKYWWDGADAPVDGRWVDRKSGLRFTLNGTNVYDSENGLYDFTTQSNYGIISSTPNAVNFSMGNHWRFDFDILIDRSASSQTTTFFDVGSVTAATKAIGFGACNFSGTSTIRSIINWKMQGNTSNPIPTEATHPALPITPADTLARDIGSYKIIDGGDGYDRLIITVNGIKVQYDSVKIPQVDYAPTWNANRMYIGATCNSDYWPSCKIKYVKIYVYD